MQLGVDALQGGAVVEQHLPQAQHRLVDLGGVGARAALDPADRRDEVAAQRRLGDRERLELRRGEPVGDVAERRAAGAHDEHALVVAHERRDDVHERLREARAGQRLDDERVAGGGLGDHRVLLAVGVEHEPVDLGIALVLRRLVDATAALAQPPGRLLVAAHRIQHVVLLLLQVGGHRLAHVGEGRREEPRLDGEARHVRRGLPQRVEHRVGGERALAGAELDQLALVEPHAVVAAQQAREPWVDEGTAEQLQLEVAAAAAHDERAQQHGPVDLAHRAVAARVREAGHADAEVHGVDRAGGGELDALRGDRGGGAARGAQRQVVADEAREGRRAAGDELREPAGMRRGELDARRGRVDEVGQGAASADAAQRLRPRLPLALALGRLRLGRGDRGRGERTVGTGGARRVGVAGHRLVRVELAGVARRRVDGRVGLDLDLFFAHAVTIAALCAPGRVTLRAGAESRADPARGPDRALGGPPHPALTLVTSL